MDCYTNDGYTRHLHNVDIFLVGKKREKPDRMCLADKYGSGIILTSCKLAYCKYC
jgi:hypothetical protein